MKRRIALLLAVVGCGSCSQRSATNATAASPGTIRIVDTPSPDAVPLDANAAAMDDDVQPDEQVVETNSL